MYMIFYYINELFDSDNRGRLYEVIARYSKKRPIMVFCSTRSIAAATAKNLAKWWSSKRMHQAFWDAPSRHFGVLNIDLKGIETFFHTSLY